MASYENVSPEYLAKLFLNDIKARVSAVLYKEMQKAVDEAVDKSVENLKANIQSWRSADRFGEEIYITLVDKRGNDG